MEEYLFAFEYIVTPIAVIGGYCMLSIYCSKLWKKTRLMHPSLKKDIIRATALSLPLSPGVIVGPCLILPLPAILFIPIALSIGAPLSTVFYLGVVPAITSWVIVILVFGGIRKLRSRK